MTFNCPFNQQTFEAEKVACELIELSKLGEELGITSSSLTNIKNKGQSAYCFFMRN